MRGTFGILPWWTDSKKLAHRTNIRYSASETIKYRNNQQDTTCIPTPMRNVKQTKDIIQQTASHPPHFSMNKNINEYGSNNTRNNKQNNRNHKPDYTTPNWFRITCLEYIA